MTPLPPSTYAHLAVLYRDCNPEHSDSQLAFRSLPNRLREIFCHYIDEFAKSSRSMQKAQCQLTQMPPYWTKAQIQETVKRLSMDTLEATPLAVQDKLLDDFFFIHGYQTSIFSQLPASIQERSCLCKLRQAKKRKIEEIEGVKAMEKRDQTLDWLSLFDQSLGDWTLHLLLEMEDWQNAEPREKRKEALRQIHFFLADRRMTSLNISRLALTRLPPIFTEPFTERLEHLDASGNFIRYLPAEVNKLRNLTTLIFSQNPAAFLPVDLGHLNRLTFFEADDYSLRRYISELYSEQRGPKTIRRYFFPPIGKSMPCSWLFTPEDGLFCQVKYPKESYARGRCRVKKLAFRMGTCELVARVVQKIKANPAKEIHAVLRTNKILDRLRLAKGMVKKYFDALILSHQKVWKIVSYEKNYNLDNLAVFLSKIAPNEVQKYRITHDLLQAVTSLHNQLIYHRNLRPEHVLLHAEDGALNTIRAALTGLSHCWIANDTPREKQLYYNYLDINYLAPEIYSLYRQSIEPQIEQLVLGDSWALGLILYQLWNNAEMPFGMPLDGDKKQEEYLLSISTHLAHLPSKAPFVEPGKERRIYHLIWKLLQFDPKNRISPRMAFSRFRRFSISKDVWT